MDKKSLKPRLTKQEMDERYPDRVPPSELEEFTGVARSVECYLTNGSFRNFRIVTMHLKDGVVEKIEKSDPYASFEVIARMELEMHKSIISLNNKWKNGRTLEK